MTFSDDEEMVGRASRRIAEHLRGRGLRFELIAVDEDSGDNSHAVLALVRKEIPELRVLTATARGRGLSLGAAEARGRVVWFIDVHAAVSPLAPFGRAYRFVDRGQADLVIVPGRFTVAYRSRTASVLDNLRGRGDIFERRLRKRAKAARLAVETQAAGGSASGGRMPGERRWDRLLEVLTAARAPWLD